MVMLTGFCQARPSGRRGVARVLTPPPTLAPNPHPNDPNPNPKQAVGQLFIFFTIKKFGPIVFTIMMTIRQMLSMVFSCILYGHPMAAISVVRLDPTR